MASSESTVVAKVTASMVVKLSSAPPCVMSSPCSAQPRTRQDRYGVGQNSARIASVFSYRSTQRRMRWRVCSAVGLPEPVPGVEAARVSGVGAVLA